MAAEALRQHLLRLSFQQQPLRIDPDPPRLRLAAERAPKIF
jgi:hypothetical protein